MRYEDISLMGKVALVTGSSRSIGKGIALELGALGATVYVTGRTLKTEDSPEVAGSPVAERSLIPCVKLTSSAAKALEFNAITVTTTMYENFLIKSK